jgi:phage terminase large subunit-like protein
LIADHRNIPAEIQGYRTTPAAGGDYWFDDEAAERAVRFFPNVLQFTRGLKAREPFRLERWQEDIIRTLFGWKRADGSRRYREAYITVPRKNGKSTLIAGLAIFVLCCDGEAGAECYCAASNRDQASLVFNSAARMVRESSLSKRCKVRLSQKRIMYDDSFLRAIPANEGGSHGFDSHFIVGDELHAWPGREFHDVLHTSTGARSQPLELYITTAGYDRNSVCYEKYSYACQVRDGKIDDPTFLPVIYETEGDDDWQSPEVWAKANPNLGVSVSEDYIRRECEKAKRNPRYENTFRRLHLNQWTSQESRWLQMEKWRKCLAGGGIEVGPPVYGGLDLSSNIDVTAWVMAQPVGDGYRLYGHYFIPEGTMQEAERRDRVPYSMWAKAGWVTPTPGDTVDYDYVHARVMADAERYAIQAVGYDPWQAHHTWKYFEMQGLTCVKVSQGASGMSSPAKELERCVIDGKLDHSGDPVLEWMAENVQVKTDHNGNITLVKPDHHASAKRIDGIIAAVMAIGMAQVLEPDGPSIYSEPGNLLL